MNLCCVFVSNKVYFQKFISTCNELIVNGNYHGDICLVVGNDLLNDELLNHPLIKNNNIIIKYFPDIEFPNEFTRVNNTINSDGRNITKKFQWHKLHLFNVYFKQWDSIFYIDCGMNIFADISPMLKLVTKDTLLAHSDAYPTYEWKLRNQFDHENTEYFTKLSSKFDLEIDYFQTGILLYDTAVIEEDTFATLYKLAVEFPISKTNEQGIMNLYFNCDKHNWKQIQLRDESTNYYDYWSRNKNDTRYIIVKVKNW